ncbi:Zn-ribbon domain-containing OB-fold protein [Agromyces sp. SYSU T00194]|uniref:Zn-ribbon domain-containing OB-fold protein n=1 Tax=Agromyces chitinivorans TaxID=3158560 RepID=UPI003390DAA6
MSEPVLPNVTEANAPFWEGCAAGELRVQACDRCGLLRYPIAPWCPRCLAEECTWTPLSGDGEVLSTLVFHQRYHPAWADRLPYNVVLVQLDEGPRMLSNVTPLSETHVPVGSRVHVAFEEESGVAIPRFRIVGT